MFKSEAVKDIVNYGTLLVSAKSDGTYLYTASASPRVLHKYSLDSMTPVASTTIFSTTTTPTDLCLVPGSAIVVSSSARTAFVDLTTLYATEVTSNAAATTTSSMGNQIAYNSTSGLALATAAVNREMTLINPGVGTHSAFILTHAEVTGTTRASCVITKTASTHDTDTLSWLVGTTNGVILEVNSSATILKSINLPRTPNTGSTVYQGILGLSYSYPNLVVTTDHGLLYTYNYETSTIINKQMIADGVDTVGVQTGITVCPSATGFTMLGPGLARNAGGSPVVGMYFKETNPAFVVQDRDSAEAGFSTLLTNDYAVEVLYTSSPNRYSMRRYSTAGIKYTTEETEIHEPVGVRVPGRIIRIRDCGPGQSFVESDTSISAETTTISCRDGGTYIELAINDDDDMWDIREFTK